MKGVLLTSFPCASPLLKLCCNIKGVQVKHLLEEEDRFVGGNPPWDVGVMDMAPCEEGKRVTANTFSKVDQL